MDEHILSLSYGKDSIACLEAIRLLGLPLDRIVHAEIWATDTISADLPPMVEFKSRADRIIKERYGIKVEHICAMRNGEKLTYEKMFYHVPKRRERDDWNGLPKGFPMQTGSYCKKLKLNAFHTGRLSRVGNTNNALLHRESQNETSRSNLWDFQCEKEIGVPAVSKSAFSSKPACTTGEKINIVQYLGIAADEPERIERHSKRADVRLPLVKIGWDEAYCRQWCEENDLLSPIYTTATHGGCWFCHNQGIDQLRLLRKNYPDLWTLLLKWDNDSPVTFHADGHTVHDFDCRFSYEDFGIVPCDRKFRWKMLKERQGEWLSRLLEE